MICSYKARGPGLLADDPRADCSKQSSPVLSSAGTETGSVSSACWSERGMSVISGQGNVRLAVLAHPTRQFKWVHYVNARV